MYLLFLIFVCFILHCSEEQQVKEEQQVTLYTFSIDKDSYSYLKTVSTETYECLWPTKEYKVYEIKGEEYLNLTEVIDSNKDILKTRRKICFFKSPLVYMDKYYPYDPNVELCFGDCFIALKEIPCVYRIIFLTGRENIFKKVTTDFVGKSDISQNNKAEITNSKPIFRFLPLLAGVSFIAVLLCGILYVNRRK